MRVYSKTNDLCARCHLAREYDTPDHHLHEPGSPAAQCVECHMPARNYMVVDPRRDHSLRVPRPDLSDRIGVPNACNRCHQDRTPAWATRQIDRRHGTAWRETPHYGEAIHTGRHGLPGAETALIQLARDDTSPGIARATALSLLTGSGRASTVQAIGEGLASEDPLIRLGAVYGLAALEPPLAFRMGHRLLDDPVHTVRIETALMLARTPAGLMSEEERALLADALEEYEAAQLVNAERAESHLNLGLLYVYRGKLDEAEESYRTAIRIEPRSVPAYVNLADLYRMQQRDEEGGEMLERALTVNPDAADVHHALGLLLVRQKRPDEALEPLRRAMDLAPDNGRYAYVYGVALYSRGDADGALAVLDRALSENPRDPEVLTGLMTIHSETGRQDEAVECARRLLEIDPRNPSANQLLGQSGTP
jgi:tetratricopeptide (TPR) repeat protein